MAGRRKKRRKGKPRPRQVLSLQAGSYTSGLCDGAVGGSCGGSGVPSAFASPARMEAFLPAPGDFVHARPAVHINVCPKPKPRTVQMINRNIVHQVRRNVMFLAAAESPHAML